MSLSPGVLDSVPWIIAKVVIASESYTMNGAVIVTYSNVLLVSGKY